MQGIVKKVSTTFAALFCSGLLVSCTQHASLCDKDGRLPYKVSGVTDPSMVAAKYRLSSAGLEVISIGQEQLISIPAQRLFKNQSPLLTWNSYSLLNMVVGYLKEYRMIDIHVNTYSGKGMIEERNKALTLARAKAVSKYLWSQGIDSRFIFAEGAGRDKPIAGDPTGGDASVNYYLQKALVVLNLLHIVARWGMHLLMLVWKLFLDNSLLRKRHRL